MEPIVFSLSCSPVSNDKSKVEISVQSVDSCETTESYIHYKDENGANKCSKRFKIQIEKKNYPFNNNNYNNKQGSTSYSKPNQLDNIDTNQSNDLAKNLQEPIIEVGEIMTKLLTAMKDFIDPISKLSEDVNDGHGKSYNPSTSVE